MKKAIEVNNLNHAYGNVSVLTDVTFSVPEGSFFVIIGPNGSGKTTLLKCMSGMEKVPGNGVTILDKPMHHFSRKDLARKMAMVSQNVMSDFPFTVTEVVLMGRSPHMGVLGLDQKHDIDIASQAMKFTEVGHLADRKISQLSGGERQRVFIARAICQEPKIILLDEPTSALDLAHQLRVMDLMEQLKKEKDITIIMVSHDINMAAMYGDGLLLLKEGRIVKKGKPADVINYEILEETYGCRLLVDQSPLGEYPRITLVPEKFAKTGG
ncbi:MAG: ABC transporter ATP-binding protein [Desulfobacterales bacterium]|nr:ABC transporter ATP-binding protein [Desulfobacterales bacterium]